MQVKSIITKIKEINKTQKEMQYIRVETIEGNEIVFWGSLNSCVNLLALEKQTMPVFITCQDCKKEDSCNHLLGDYFSVPEETIVTIYPYNPKKITRLMKTVKDTNKLINSLQSGFL